MKKKLLDFADVHILKRNEKLYAECYYMLSSEAVALNTYFQTKRDVLRAHKMFERHLKLVMDVIDYLFTPNGWTLLVIVKTEEEILNNIDLNKYNSLKMKNAVKNRDIPVILSECMRYAISGMTRRSNINNEKSGAVVGQNFRRFIVGDVDSALQVMRKMKDEQIQLCWQKSRYRPRLEMCVELMELVGKGDVFLCTKHYGIGNKLSGMKEKCLTIIEKTNTVLRKCIELTLSQYFNAYYTKYPKLFIQMI